MKGESEIEYIVTASEDQTVKVSRVKEMEEIEPVQTLRGHQLAVTSVKWLKETMVSISDDKTVRVYRFKAEEGEFELTRVLDSSSVVHCWHTLTYLELYECQSQLVVNVVTENGYMIQWTLLDQ